MTKLIAKIDKLMAFESEQIAYVSRPLLAYLNEWLNFSDERKLLELQGLQTALTGGLDVDFAGTKWEAEWLSDNKICQCKACVTARNCLTIIREINL